VRYFVPLTLAGMVLFATQSLAEGNLDGLSHLSIPPDKAEPATKAPADPWGAAPAVGLSIVNAAPVVLPFFNNGPVFGIPGTVVGDFWQNTQVTGDWGGARTELARRGWFLDLYTTTYYQNVTAGGIKANESFVHNTQFSVNIDTARAGYWAGGLFHITTQSRNGSSFDDTFTAGTFVPQYAGLVHPDPSLANDTLLTEYYLVQALTKEVSVIGGRISNVFLPDATMFANSYKYYFASFSLNKNPMTTNFYTPTALAGLVTWAPNKQFLLLAGVLDPNSTAENFTKDAFETQNYYVQPIVSYQLGGLPGQLVVAYNWSNQRQIDFNRPFGTLSPGQVESAVAALLGGPNAGLPINFEGYSWFIIGNIAQYLYVRDDAATVAVKLKSGQPLDGIGIIARAGYAPPETNSVTRDASVALFAHGLFPSRPYDSFGVGYYYNGFSGDLKQSLSNLTLNTVKLKDENGIEVFYDFAITPAIRLIPGYQHIWEPFFAQVETKQNAADVFLARLTVAW
jgi:porin